MESKVLPCPGHVSVTVPTLPAPRLATVPLRGGGTLTTTCPSWCAVAHDTREHPIDVAHVSQQIAVTLPVHGGQETILRAQILHTPYGGEFREPSAVLWPSDHGEVREHMSPADLDETIAAVAAYLDQLQTLRTRLVAAQDEHEATRLA